MAVLAFAVVCQWIVAATVGAAAPAAAERCADPCACKGRLGYEGPVIEARALGACLRQGRPIDLRAVRIRGDIDLNELPCRPHGRGGVDVPGVENVHTGLGFLALERRIGRRVPGSRLVAASVSIQDSTIEGRLLGAVSAADARTFCPVVFVQAVNLNGTVLRGEVRLPNVRFRRPLTAIGTIFEHPIDVRGTRFAENTTFNHARIVKLSARDAEFERAAAFRGVEVKEEAGFESVAFRGDAWFDNPVDETRRLNNVDFSEATFGGEARFEDAQFVAPTHFTKVKFEQAARLSRARFIGDVDFSGAQFGGRTTFTGNIFEGAVSFLRASFDSKLGVVFDDAQFKGEVRFVETRFAGPSGFVSAGFRRAQFLNVSFADAADFRDTVFAEAAEFGGGNTRTTFGGPATFAFSKMAVANFENANFKGPTNFAGARFGDADEPAACRGGSSIIVNLWGASFDDGANFMATEFNGGVNLSHTTMTAGRVRWHWRQLEGVVQSDSVVLAAEAACKNVPRFRAVPNRRALPLPDIFAWLEKNFRSLDQLRDANAAFYSKEEEEVTVALSQSRSVLERCGLWLWRWLYGRTSGYGVMPGRVVILLAGLLVGFGALYAASARPLRFDATAARVAFKVQELPYLATVPPPASASTRRALCALAVSASALLSLRLQGAYLLERPGRWAWWFVVGAERVLGYLLLALLAWTLARSVPGVEKVLSWLL